MATAVWAHPGQKVWGGKTRGWRLRGKILFEGTRRLMGLLQAACCILPVSEGESRGSAGLHPDARFILDQVSAIGEGLGIGPAILLSACRSQDYQRSLIARWDRGDRVGLRVRPSETSMHVAGDDGFCRAFDLANTDDWLYTVGPKAISLFPGLEWGGRYFPPDPNHFELNVLPFSVRL